MAYNVYKNDELIAEGIEEQTHKVTGLKPNTSYTFAVTEVLGEKESGKAEVDVKTKPVSVTDVEMSPKNMTGEAGSAGERQLNVTVSPTTATNKDVTYSVTPQTAGLSVSASGLLKWSDAVPANTYSVKSKSVDGNKEAVSTLTLSEPVPEPEPEPDETPE